MKLQIEHYLMMVLGWSTILLALVGPFFRILLHPELTAWVYDRFMERGIDPTLALVVLGLFGSFILHLSPSFVKSHRGG